MYSALYGIDGYLPPILHALYQTSSDNLSFSCRYCFANPQTIQFLMIVVETTEIISMTLNLNYYKAQQT